MDRTHPLLPRLSTLLALVTAMLATLDAPARAQVVRGVVVDAETRQPMGGVSIELLAEGLQSPIATTSDSLGRFVLAAPRPGAYTLQTRRIGFAVAEPAAIHLRQGETMNVELRLGAGAAPLEPVLVTDHGARWLDEFDSRKGGAFGKFLTREDIEARGALQTTDLFRMAPGFVVTPRRRGGTTLLMRGTAGLCQPALWIDGLNVTSTTSATSIDNLLAPQVIAGVEIYNSVAAAPTQYRTGSCGVLLFWTRRGSATEGKHVHWTRLVGGAIVAVALLVFFVR